MTTYEVTRGEKFATIELTQGEEVAVKFSYDAYSFAVSANGGDVDVSIHPNLSTGDDGVLTVVDGTSAAYPHMKGGINTVYLSGAGTATVFASNEVINPFKAGKRGGDGGGDNTHYKGTTTTALENGSTTNPIVIDGESYTAVFGDVVVYGYTEFVFDGTQWSEFGRPFDTTPTSGSTNAVTSNGIYMRTPWGRHTTSSGAQIGVSASAPGSASLAVGYHSTSRGTSSLALGYYASTTSDANYSAAIGNYTQVTNSSMLAIGKYNSPRTGDLFNIGNGSSSTRSNIVEVNDTSANVNGDIKINNIAIPTPYTTMPTITADMLGKIAQYVGETTNNYVKGYFYIASSDGAAQPTYSWQALMDTTPTQGSTNAVTSDGIYAVTPFARGLNEKSAVLAGMNCSATTSGSVAIGSSTMAYGGYQAFACGNSTRASNSNTFAAGYQSQASGFASSSFGSATYTNQTAQMAVGIRNNPLADDLFEVGNGTETTGRSNIFEVSRSHANVNGDIKINNVAIPTPYTTMPTITADMLGKIAMYVGVTGNGYTQGCFYIASTDGAAEPTYSWVRIGCGRTETVLWENTGTTNPDTITLSEAWSNFDELAIITDYPDYHYINTNIKLTSTFIVGEKAVFWYDDNTASAGYIVTSSTTFTLADAAGRYFLSKIIGIKY